MIIAALKGEESMMELLIGKGADINAKEMSNLTALIIAVRKGARSHLLIFIQKKKLTSRST